MPEQYEDGPVELAKGLVVSGRWRVAKKLGEGGCGAVYLVDDIKSTQGKQAALKAESNFVEGGSVLKLEAEVLHRLRGKRNVAELLAGGKRTKYQFIVMTLLGDSLNNLLRRCNKSCSISTQIRVGVQILYGIKQVHDVSQSTFNSSIHRDIKPANLSVGRAPSSDPQIIHILDFGLSREYVVRKGDAVTLRLPRRRALFRGTTRYCSCSVHDRNEQSRADDLWSLLYVMVELRGRLPWASLRGKHDIAKSKRTTTDADLFKNSPPHLITFAAHLRTLTYHTRPDYLQLFKLLNEAMKQNGFSFTDQFDWDVAATPNIGARLKQSILKTISIEDEEKPKKKAASVAKNATTSATLDTEPILRNIAEMEATQADEGERGCLYRDEDFSSDPLGL